MVVSAILLATMAPITGALFGASYGTAIRIGYEIIFPALFGDLLKEQNRRGVGGNQATSDEGAKKTIKALHTMFTLVGGASAMEFGVAQGIEMAKKKTESPDVQNMINLSLGLTDEQINRRHIINSQNLQNTPEQIRDAELALSPQVPGFATPPGGDLTIFRQMKKNYPNTDKGNRKLWKIMETGNEFGIRTPKQKIALIELYKQRRKEHPELFKAFDNPNVQQIIEDTSSGLVKQIASLYNQIALVFRVKRKNRFWEINQMRTMQAYNRLVQSNRKANLTIDTRRSIQQWKIVPKS